MTNKLPTEKFKDEQVCSWCGARFRPDGPQKRPVCQRCIRLLTDAGISDEEIFGGGKSGDDDEKDEG